MRFPVKHKKKKKAFPLTFKGEKIFAKPNLNKFDD